jgi:hypothetical protein
MDCRQAEKVSRVSPAKRGGLMNGKIPEHQPVLQKIHVPLLVLLVLKRSCFFENQCLD